MKILHALIILCILPLIACNSFSNKRNQLYKIPDLPVSVLNTNLQQQFSTGIDFIASGEKIADWTLAINFDDSIKFQAQNGLSFTIPAMRPEVDIDSIQIFSSNISLGKVIIIIKKGNCNNTISSNETLSRECSVTIGQISYTGCGQFLYNSQLEGKWILQKYKAISISENTFKNGIPFLKFEILSNKLSGFDGCNNISGIADLQGKRIKFSDFTTTKKLCNTSPLPNLFSILEKQLAGYKIVNELLYIFLIDDSVLILKKSI